MYYHLPTVKRWLKNAAKKGNNSFKFSRLIYDAKRQWVCDGNALLTVTYEMHPTLLELFGHSDGGYIKNGVLVSDNIPDLSYYVPASLDEVQAQELIDSRLTLRIDGETRAWIFTQRGSNAKVLMSQKYAELFAYLAYLPAYWRVGPDIHGSILITQDHRIVAVVMPIIIADHYTRWLRFSYPVEEQE